MAICDWCGFEKEWEELTYDGEYAIEKTGRMQPDEDTYWMCLDCIRGIYDGEM